MPRICKIFFVAAALLVVTVSRGHSQKIDKDFEKHYQTASAVYERGAIDSAIILFTKLMATAEVKHYNAHVYTSNGYNVLGYCFTEKKNYLLAHLNFSKGLANARHYHHEGAITFALKSLSQLHHLIQLSDIEFPYKAPATTVAEIVSFAIEKVEQITPDSCRITIAGGKLDGLRDSTTRGIVLCRYDKTTAREAGKFIGDAKIYRMDNNTTYATVKTNGITPLSKDVVRIKAEVPVAIAQSSLKSFLLQAIFFNSNSRERLFDRRYIYYYYDPAIEKEAFNIFSDQIKEIVANKITAEDTTGEGVYAAKIDDGLFKGRNVIKGILLSDSTTYKLFLDYVLQNPENYIGNDFKFSEVFATWILYKTPLVKDDAIKYLIGIHNIEKRREEARKLYTQIEEAHLSDRWLDDAVQFANLENIKDARQYARILFDVGMANKNDRDIGWAFYVDALCQNKLGNTGMADTTLDASLGHFKKINDQEGAIWVANARALFKQKPTPVLSVQTGHLLPYSLALSPNPRYFATGSDDNTIKIWDIQLVREIKTIKAHDDVVNCLNYSPGGRYIVSSSEDKTIKIWNAYDYSLVQTIKLNTSVQLVKFTPDGRKLVCGTRDSLITFYDPISGKLLATTPKQRANVTDIIFHPQNPKIMVSSCRDSTIAFWNVDSLKTTGNGTMGGFALTLRWSNDGNYLAAFCSDTNLRVLNLSTFKWQYYYKINFIKVAGSTYVGSGSFSPDSRYLVFAGKNGQEAMLDLVKGKKTAFYNSSTSLANINFAANGSYFVEDYFFGEPIKIIDFNLPDPSVLPAHLIATEFRSFVNMPVGLKFGNDSKSLYILSIDLKKFNFINGASEVVTDEFQVNSNANNHLVLNDNNLTTYVNPEIPAVIVYDYKNKKELKTFPAIKGRVRTYSFSANDSLCFVGNDKRTVTGYNVKTQKVLFTHSYYAPSDTMVRGIFTDDYHSKLLIKLAAGKILVADMFTGALRDSIVLQGNYGLALTRRYIFVTCNDGYLYEYSADNYKLLKKVQIDKTDKNLGLLALTPDSAKLVIQTDRSLVLFNIADEKIIYDEPIGTFLVTEMVVSPDGKYIAVAKGDNKVTLHHLETGKLITIINTPANSEFVVTDTAGYYMAPKRSLDGIVFNYNGNAYNYEQFDLQYNRPDIVLAEIGRADPNLIAAYKKAYLKRITKLGLTENDLKQQLHLPSVKIVNKFTTKPTTTDSLFSMQVACSDAKYKIQSIQVLVNNVPLFANSGKDISRLDTNNLIYNTKIPLSQGNNIIKVYCVNKNGASSIKESFEIYCNKPKYKSRTYFFGIAVARYKDIKMNLTYPAKDVRDLAALFKKLDPSVIIDTLINQQATVTNILAMKKRLQHTSVDDKIIMAVTGHGLLSDNMDFYYATYDVDFKNPAAKGLQYQVLEGLLNDIPARQKLLLIDACHSGELDREVTINNTAKRTDNKPIAVNGTKGVIVSVSKEAGTVQNSFELMQNLFVDLSVSNGTVIISATGGLEFAFESAAWKNGVFTYCIRTGIEDKLADKNGGNNDGKVTVQELLQYVSRQVALLTHGMQKPASRRENLDYDWTIR